MKRLVLCLPLSTACFSAELDPAATDVYACVGSEDCPPSQVCSAGFCTSPENIVEVTITTPEPNQIFSPEALRDGVIEVNVNSNLDLVEPGGERVGPRSGFLRLRVDGETREITTGDAGLVSESFTIEPTPGGHRIAVQAFAPDGSPFPNPEAFFATVVWIDDGEPHALIVSPWPGLHFPLEATSVEAVVHTLNFDLVPPGPPAGLEDPIAGHPHLHYDDDFPACATDPACDAGPIAILQEIIDRPSGSPNLAAARGARVTLPAAQRPGPARLTAILRESDHAPYLHPLDAPAADRRLLLDEIQIERRAP